MSEQRHRARREPRTRALSEEPQEEWTSDGLGKLLRFVVPERDRHGFRLDNYGRNRRHDDSPKRLQDVAFQHVRAKTARQAIAFYFLGQRVATLPVSRWKAALECLRHPLMPVLESLQHRLEFVERVFPRLLHGARRIRRTGISIKSAVWVRSRKEEKAGGYAMCGQP